MRNCPRAPATSFFKQSANQLTKLALRRALLMGGAAAAAVGLGLSLSLSLSRLKFKAPAPLGLSRLKFKAPPLLESLVSFEAVGGFVSDAMLTTTRARRE